MPDGTQRRLVAIVSADVAGYSRLMGADEAGTLAAMRSHRSQLWTPTIEQFGGRVVGTAGDSILVEFGSAVAAVESSIAVQRGMLERNGDVPEDKRMLLRIGINIGEVIIDGDDIYGDGVNVAARLQEIAAPGGIAMSGNIQEQIEGKLDETFFDDGLHEVKNIARPVQVWRWSPDGNAPFSTSTNVSKPVSGFDGRPAIAVLPFDNMSGDTEQEYFADGIAEDILTRLAMWRWLPVIARNSSFTFKGQSVDITEAGRSLGARYVLEGSVRKAGNRVRVTGQLIDTESGHHLWADRYDRKLEDIFDLQDEITEAIVTALEPTVGHAEMKRAHRLTSDDLGAWDRTQRALWHFNKFTKDDLAIALDVLQAVIAEKPDYTQALSYAALTRVLHVMFAWTDDPAAALMDANKFATAAVANDRMNPLANAVIGLLQAHQGRHAAGIESARRAIELNPSFAIGHHLLGAVYMFDGQPHEAISAIQKAVRLSPFDDLRAMWLATLSASYYLAGEYERALEVADRAVEVGPHYPLALRSRPNALAQLGRMEEARAALDEFLRLAPTYTVASGRAGVPFRREADFQLYMEGLRKAGLPEQ